MALDRAIAVSALRYIARLLVSLNLGTPKPEKPDSVTYRVVYRLAKRHFVAGAIWNILEDEVRATEDAELISRFEIECELDAVKHAVQSREFAVVTERLSEEGIDFLPLKGFLMKSLWSRPEYRSMADMDMYVSEAGVKRAGRILESLGYEPNHDGAVHYSYIKPPYVNIELHKVLGSSSEGDFCDWSTKEGSEHWYVMSLEDQLLFMLGHMYKHYRGGGNGIRSFFDLYLYLRRYGDAIDWERVDAALAEREITEFYNNARKLMDLWFGDASAEPSEELLEMEYYILTGGMFGTVENRVSYATAGKTKLQYLFSRVFLPYSSMKQMYKWLRPLPFLLPFAWLFRFVAALFDGRMKREVKAVATVFDSPEREQ